MQAIINGAWVDSSDKATMNITNPYTGKVVGKVPNCTEKDVNKAVSYAEKAQKKWAKVPVHQKVELVNKFLDLVQENRNDLAKTLCVETGKPITQAFAEIDNVKISFTAFSERAKHLYGAVIPAGTEAGQENTLQFTQREPLGVIGVIIPFNLPIDLFDQKVAPALLAGNAVVIKPPHQNPSTIIKLVALMLQAGFPSGVVQVLTGDGLKTGNAITKHPKVHGISFTGSIAVGKSVYKNASEHFAHVTLELGGNDPFILLDDADIDLAVEEVVWGRMYNAGQVCVASKRFIVDKKVVKEFEIKVVERLKKLVVGNPLDKKTDIGTLVTLQAAEKVEKQVKNIVNQGGKILYGAKREGATYFPTVITNIPASADVAKDDEVFGPVVSIIPVDNMEEAVKVANQSNHGLGSCVFTRDMKKAFKIANSMEAGGCVINGASFHRSFEMPFGGYKISGLGTEGVMSTFDHVTKLKTITLKNILK